MSYLLMGEKPLLVIPALAVKVGLNEALVLQQIHYCVKSSTHVIEGRRWIYNIYKEWQLQFPFWSESTIKRTFHSLEKQGLIVSGNWNHSKMDKTKWYTIDYECVEELEETNDVMTIPQEESSESDGEETNPIQTAKQKNGEGDGNEKKNSRRSVNRYDNGCSFSESTTFGGDHWI